MPFPKIREKKKGISIMLMILIPRKSPNVPPRMEMFSKFDLNIED